MKTMARYARRLHALVIRHPLTSVITFAATAAGAAILGFVLVVIPALQDAAQVPGQLGHAYAQYWNAVDQQMTQLTGGPQP